MAASKMSAQDYARMRNKTCVTCRQTYYSSLQVCPFCPPPAAKPAIVAPPPVSSGMIDLDEEDVPDSRP